MEATGFGWYAWLERDDDLEGEEKPNTKRSWYSYWLITKRCLGYCRPQAGTVALLLIIITAKALVGLLNPLLFQQMIDETLPSMDLWKVHWLGVQVLFATLSSGLLDVWKQRLVAKVSENLMTDLRCDFFKHAQKMSLYFFIKTKNSELSSRYYMDVYKAQEFLSTVLIDATSNIILFIVTVSLAIHYEWRLTVLTLMAVPFCYFPAIRLSGPLRKADRKENEEAQEASAIFDETLTVDGLLLNKLFGQTEASYAKYQGHMEKSRDLGVTRSTLNSWFFFVLSLGACVSTSLVKWIGGLLVLNGSFTPGTIVAFCSFIVHLHSPLMTLSNVPVRFAQSAHSFERIFDLFDIEPEICECPNPVNLNKVKGTVEFRGVSFSYSELDAKQRYLTEVKRYFQWEVERGTKKTAEEIEKQEQERLSKKEATKWALSELSFFIEPGQLVAVVGPSGAGKSTLSLLLPRLYDPTSGSIEIDGHDLRSLSFSSLANIIGMVTQDTFLFYDTIAANIRFAKPEATLKEVEEAARAANIHEFIQSLPDGYDTVVGERGHRLSGGERQRVSIARVLLKDPQILVMDEATSSLDTISESLIQQAFEKIRTGRTTLVIAHRLSTILKADVILVMDKGKLVERGRHQELLQQGGLYATLYQTQFKSDGTADDSCN